MLLHLTLLVISSQPVLQYAIFPMQFAYLYSYFPSGEMRETAAALEAKWKEKHYKASEENFARVATEGQSVAMPSFFKKAEIAAPEVKKTTDLPATVLQAKKESTE
jgi:zeaxanthin epoxidase